MRRITPITAPKAFALIICQSTTLDPQSDQWSIHGTFAGMTLEKLPVMYPEFHVYYALEKSDNIQDAVYLDVIAPDSNVISQNLTVIKWDPNAEGAEQRVAFRDVIFRKPGQYTVRLRTEGRMLAERHMQVTEAGQA